MLSLAETGAREHPLPRRPNSFPSSAVAMPGSRAARSPATCSARRCACAGSAARRSALAAESENDLALLLLADGRPDAAVKSLREALAHLRDSGGEQNALGVEIWRGIGRRVHRDSTTLPRPKRHTARP